MYYIRSRVTDEIQTPRGYSVYCYVNYWIDDRFAMASYLACTKDADSESDFNKGNWYLNNQHDEQNWLVPCFYAIIALGATSACSVTMDDTYQFGPYTFTRSSMSRFDILVECSYLSVEVLDTMGSSRQWRTMQNVYLSQAATVHGWMVPCFCVLVWL